MLFDFSGIERMSAIHFLLGAKYLRQDLEDTERQNLEETKFLPKTH